MPIQSPRPMAFSLKGNAHLPFLELELLITYPGQKQPATATKALLSTADTRTRISQLVVDALGLEVSTGSDGTQQTVLLDMYLAKQVRIASFPALVQDSLPHQRDCIIGMDILTQGDISMSGAGGRTVFSFRIPAQGGLDYVEIINAETPQQRGVVTNAQSTPAANPAMPEPARNIGRAVPSSRDQPCPCGSGKKHKNCCGRLNRSSRRSNTQKNKK